MKKTSLKGISMVILIITVVILLILVSAVVLTVEDQDSINKAKEAVLRDDINALKTDLNAYIDNKRFAAISKGQYYDPKSDNTLKEITDYSTLSTILPSMMEDYEGIFCIKDAQITYIGSDKSNETIKILDEMGVNYDKSVYQIVDEESQE